jgi:hypothetical protein
MDENVIDVNFTIDFIYPIKSDTNPGFILGEQLSRQGLIQLSELLVSKEIVSISLKIPI